MVRMPRVAHGFTIGIGILMVVMQLDEALGLLATNGAGLWGQMSGSLALIEAV